MTDVTLAELVDRVERLAAERPGGRVIVGIVGAPGSGKSTLAELLVATLRDRTGVDDAVALVPMDGFHLAQVQLDALGRSDRKGAPDTFDAAGFTALLRRIRDGGLPGRPDVYAPRFERSIEEPIAGSVRIGADARIVIVEGNYLLLDRDGWSDAAALLDEAWFLRVPQEVRIGRLVARHRLFGRSEADAQAWAAEVDEPNARLIEASAGRADLVVEIADPLG
ncbi:nucleoside/nucleotide kinase family protein [Plantibacter sp. Mn2098]|uniref:nucleoside/nucleotide kinase family protein n=1 Tax=Plantibacter sp. Mn2098 TaxID=3395266 RepID=UPI003BDD72BC